MSRAFLSTFCFVCAVPCLASASSFLLGSGITADKEMCVVAKQGNNAAALGPCDSAALQNDGAWQLNGKGQLSAVNGGLCLGAAGAALGPCDEASGEWEFTETNQLRTRGGSKCLRTDGPAGQQNRALHASVSASSSANEAHGAAKTVDGDEASYWASKFDEPGPVTLTLDLGGPTAVDTAEIAWAFVPKSFSLAVSADGLAFREIYSTNANIIDVSRIGLGGQTVTKVKLVLEEADPLHGKVGDHKVFGIRSLAMVSDGPGLVLADCAEAAQRTDAGDKFFSIGVSELDVSASTAYAGELPSFEAAAASLSSATSELAAALQNLGNCGETGTSMVEARAHTSKLGAANVEDANAILKQSRATILAARAAIA